MRLKILASVALLSPVLALAQAEGGIAICDSTGKCIRGAGAASSTEGAAAEPTKPVVFAAPAESLPAGPTLPAPEPELPPPPPLPPVPVVELTPVPVPAADAATAAPATVSGAQSVSVQTESGEVTVITQASAPATSSASKLPAAGLPPKGMNRAAVARQYGEPHTRRAPVGGGSPRQPPITRWDYPGFSVFFEYDHVVDAVERDNPAPIAVRDGLAGGPSPKP